MDNKSSEYADWDLDLLKQELDSLKELNFDLDLTGFDDKEVKEILGEEENIYTKKIQSPVYTPSNNKPSEAECYNKDKAIKLIELIKNSNLSAEQKEFLIFSAYRFLEFRYDKIADYYAHADKETQGLMEKLALVIIDFDKAIEEGFVKLSENLAERYLES